MVRQGGGEALPFRSAPPCVFLLSWKVHGGVSRPRAGQGGAESLAGWSGRLGPGTTGGNVLCGSRCVVVFAVNSGRSLLQILQGARVE